MMLEDFKIQWFPGHMTKAKRMMESQIKLVDVVVEMLDARIPQSSTNPMLQDILGSKPKVIALNKIDMADKAQTDLWLEKIKHSGLPVCKIDCATGKGVKQLISAVQLAAKPVIDKWLKKGVRNRPVRVMIVGIPNVGKSTFINSYAGKACAKTGNKPGVTKGKQWIRLNKNVELLDTPGILWPKFEDQRVGLYLALIGAIKDEILNIDELSLELIKILLSDYPTVLKERYGVEEDAEPPVILGQIAENRKCISKGGELDYSKAAALLIDEFRSGKLGQITLERPKIQDGSAE